MRKNENDPGTLFLAGYQLAFGRKRLLKRDWKKAFTCWLAAAEKGHIRAMFYVGTCYDFGNGVKKDVPSAFQWYSKAAKGGHRDAQFNVGMFNSKGELVKKDHKRKVFLVSEGRRGWFNRRPKGPGICLFLWRGGESRSCPGGVLV